MERTFFIAGAILAFLAVAAGAFGAHALAERIPQDRLATFEIAARYQMYHALALLVLSLAMTRWQSGTLHLAGWLFIGGTVVFCGTLYGIAFGGPKWLGAITPLGGLGFLTGWALTAWAVTRAG
jgi:uncharacterized membrane protein YgdD (TMEM256/DUF423 family)